MRVERWEIRDDSGRIRATGGVTAVDLSANARAAVLRQYERAYERHAVAEQVNRGVNDEEAQEAHQNAVRVLKARMVEDEDPKVGPPQVMHCLTCAAAYAARGK